jgi:hypothetical protein
VKRADPMTLRRTCGSCGNTAMCGTCGHDVRDHERRGPGDYDCKKCPCKGAKLGL